MSRPRDITKKLIEADPELSMYIVELEKENLRLHKKIAKLQAKNITKDNEIRALKKDSGKPITFKVVYGDKGVEKE
jgi:hypothetical protein